MKNEYTVVQPEVIVGLGDNTTGIPDHQDQIIHLHIHLEDWLGDDLVECFPCYLVTENLKNLLEKSKLSGFEFYDVEITLDEYFFENFRLAIDLPTFYWFKVIEKDQDVFIDDNLKLNVSNFFLSFIKKNASIKHMDIDPQRTDTDDFLDNLFS